MARRNRDRRERRPQRPKTVLHAHGEAGRAGSFRCAGCRLEVPATAPGTSHRNHCPHCLTSLHVDLRVPGDRAADCRGPMSAVSMASRADGEWMLVHRCARCGELSVNRIAGDDNARALVRLAVRPLAGAPSGFASVARDALVRL
ncbi:RNHCP domain-containing protein [Nocardiopsis changdeensis]|uniref:RNHCP domain-containing protein n=1 Tax=Nocardiopsis changdeensis TaxID=2831969 RepID=A0ABX8BMK3_9ACTN|nr:MULTISPECIES: RNHCP domain-containing protein [Nocardiopsis]QUX22003.1 RNHCP domain-containing protein [Nocardiopsis changdeensis]QYX37940.1 RNHCP domain-containing protein [Nocardiopsis sp. MT53]